MAGFHTFSLFFWRCWFCMKKGTGKKKSIQMYLQKMLHSAQNSVKLYKKNLICAAIEKAIWNVFCYISDIKFNIIKAFGFCFQKLISDTCGGREFFSLIIWLLAVFRITILHRRYNTYFQNIFSTPFHNSWMIAWTFLFLR